MTNPFKLVYTSKGWIINTFIANMYHLFTFYHKVETRNVFQARADCELESSDQCASSCERCCNRRYSYFPTPEIAYRFPKIRLCYQPPDFVLSQHRITDQYRCFTLPHHRAFEKKFCSKLFGSLLVDTDYCTPQYFRLYHVLRDYQ